MQKNLQVLNVSVKGLSQKDSVRTTDKKRPTDEQRSAPSFQLIGGEHGLFIGAFEDIDYENFEILLGEGDKVFIYTDGVHEAVNADEEMFTVDRMLRALNEAGTQSPAGILEHVKSSVAEFVGDVSQFDDLIIGF